MQPLLCNQAAVSHQQPITMSSFLKQFVSWELHKSWLTLAKRLLAWEKGRQGTHSLVCHFFFGGGGGVKVAAPSQAGERAASLDREVSVLQAPSLLCTVPCGTSVFLKPTACLHLPTTQVLSKASSLCSTRVTLRGCPQPSHPPSSVRGGAWCHHHHRRTSDFRGRQG